MYVSIIIPTFNRSFQLINTLNSIKNRNNTFELFEIIIVDNGSTDDTKSVVDLFMINYPEINVKYFLEPMPGLLSARHLGANEASGEILAFIDDDIIVGKYWLSSIISNFKEDNQLSFLTGPSYPFFDVYPPDWIHHFWVSDGSHCEWLSLLDLGDKKSYIDPIYVFGLNFIIKRSVFFDLKGFHPDNIPEKLQQFQGDGETGLTIKGQHLRALYDPSLLIYHNITEERLTVEYFAKRAYYAGVSRSFSEIRSKQNIGVSKKVNNTIIVAYKNLKNRFFNKFKKEDHLTLDIINLKNRFKLEEQRGYDFHRFHYNSNQTVKDWCHKSDYLDYKLPINL